MALTVTIFVQVRIRADTNRGTYEDAMTFTQAEFAALTNPQIRALAQARADAWRDRTANPPPLVLPSQAELHAYVREIRRARQEQEDEYLRRFGGPAPP